MKKIISVLMAIAIVFGLSPAVFAATQRVSSEPETYLRLTTANGVTPSLSFTLPGSIVPAEGNITLRARVRFGTDVFAKEHGSAFVNCYSYSDTEHIGNFKYLIAFTDFAKSYSGFDDDGGAPVMGSWADFSYEFDPGMPSYALGKEDTLVVINDGKAKCRALCIGVGYYLAEGTIDIANVSVEQNGKTLWSVDFSSFDPLADNSGLYLTSMTGISSDTEGINWAIGKTEKPPVPVLRGDFDSDGTLVSDDAIYLLRHVLFGEEYPITQEGDVDGDGNVNSADAIRTLRCILFPDDYF